MAGLIDKQMQPPLADTEPGAGNALPKAPGVQKTAGSPDKLGPAQVDAQIKVSPELKEPYQRVLLAGMKVLFDPQTHELALKQLEGPGPIAERLGKGIAGLMLTLFKESNRTMPPQLLIPAGTALLVRAADFLEQGGAEQVGNAEVAQAMVVMTDSLMAAFGLDPNKVLAKAGGTGLINEATPAQAPVPAEQEGV